jgi:serine/threonine-protein kinase
LPSLTATGTILGTAGYLAPEQALGEPTSPASDRYALAVVAYELLTGTRPFARESPTAEAQAHVSAPVPSASAKSDLPPEVDTVFKRALAKRPGDRYATCGTFVSALRTALAGTPTESRAPTAATLPLPSPRTVTQRPASSRKPLLAAVLGAALIAVAIAGVVIAGRSPTSERATPPAAPAKQKKAVHRTTTKQTRTAPASTTTAPQTTTTAPPPTTTTTAAPQPTAAGPHTLNDQAWGLMQQGRYAEALPLLQQAVPRLQGAGPADPAEGYANYNLGYTLVQLGRCSEGQTYLERALVLEPERKEVHKALQEAKHCLKGQA